MTIDENGKARLRELLLRWEEGREEGRDISTEELCVADPGLAGELRTRIAELEMFDRRYGSEEPGDESDAPAHRAKFVGDSRILPAAWRCGWMRPSTIRTVKSIGPAQETSPATRASWAATASSVCSARGASVAFTWAMTTSYTARWP